MTPPPSSQFVHRPPISLWFLLSLLASSPSLIFSTGNTRGGASVGVDENTVEVPPPSAAVPEFTLTNGETVPLVGLGCCSGVERRHVSSAIDAGYRYLDTAQSHAWGYREEEVGDAVRDAKMRREDHRRTTTTAATSSGTNATTSLDYAYVQTKIHPQDLGHDATKRALDVSLQRLGVSTLDSVLIHKPRCWADVCPRGAPEGTWQESWTALEEAYDAGVVRAIGICDVDERILDELMTRRIGPTVVQNWFDPYHQDKRLRARIDEINQRRRHEGMVGGIMYQGYSTLGSQWLHHKGYDQNPVLNDPTLRSIADTHGATVVQVVINWAARVHGISVLPASTNPNHQASNLESFKFQLTLQEIRAIDALDGNPPSPPDTTRGKEPNPNEVELQFVNAANLPIEVYWTPEGGSDGGGSEDHVVVGSMDAGGELSLTSYHGHSFVFRESSGTSDGDGVGRVMNRHVVDRADGRKQNHPIGDMGQEF